MKKVEFKMKVVTPLIMSGANQNRAEIRASSIKGLIRWWFRELFKEKKGEGIDYSKVREREKEIFGSALEEKGQAGKVWVSVKSEGVRIKKFGKDKRIDTRNEKGLAYLTLGGKAIGGRGYIDSDSRFTVTLMFDSSLNDTGVEDVLRAFWASVYLGNWGFRSRRGFGSVEVEKVRVSGIEGELAETLEKVFVPFSESLFREAKGWMKGRKERNCWIFREFVKVRWRNLRRDSKKTTTNSLAGLKKLMGSYYDIWEVLDEVGLAWQEARKSVQENKRGTDFKLMQKGTRRLYLPSVGMPVGYFAMKLSRQLERKYKECVEECMKKGERKCENKCRSGSVSWNDGNYGKDYGRLASRIILKVWNGGVGIVFVDKPWRAVKERNGKVEELKVVMRGGLARVVGVQGNEFDVEDIAEDVFDKFQFPQI